VLFVLPDYYADLPRACMDGWARRYLVVTPSGTVLPCHQAASITTLAWQSVREHALGAIWHESPAFRAFRGEDWLPYPCRSCSRRTLDFGGCRCQAFALTGDAGATDPACVHAPRHELVLAARARADAAPPAPMTDSARPLLKLRRRA
jgi:PqqA peptide cyclase